MTSHISLRLFFTEQSTFWKMEINSHLWSEWLPMWHRKKKSNILNTPTGASMTWPQHIRCVGIAQIRTLSLEKVFSQNSLASWSLDSGSSLGLWGSSQITHGKHTASLFQVSPWCYQCRKAFPNIKEKIFSF